MKKLLLIALLIVSCSKDEIVYKENCETQVQVYEHDPTNTVLIFEGALDEFFLIGMDRGQQYAFIITYCDGSTVKYTILNK